MPDGLAFDTLAYAKKLKSAGFTQEQAEIQAEALVEIVEGRLATKEDIRDLRRDLKELEMRLTIRLGALIASAIIIVAAMVKFL